MTALLVSVTSAAEAAAAVEAGAKVIDAKDPTAGALGALPPDTVRAIVAAVAGRVPVSAAAGDAPDVDAAAALADTGADYVKVPVGRGEAGAAALSAFGAALGARTKLVAVFAADREPDLDLVDTAAAAGFAGVMLDTVEKGAGLLDATDLAEVARFVAAGHRNKLLVGLAGSLRVVDVGTLLPLQPDLVGFRGGVCVDGDRRKALDPARVRAVATAIAVHAARRLAGA
ncbi:(5-formylfuran-3-yl)methyl phosphate synthase [Oharaeibacter diazotrophicus]|uniref:(5-formylfuran-3-yl)methyl phosphate synthase n=2 Tax=Oharaeibacter diazotrophicus TaxID=1920512 RepID=A0A4R6RJU5_9HYPH|nr:(5-formylfuran-3-yl)methyl phosphate synthase [Oharaeibacter diazotrophicus]TDP86911.1 uncharacterized protein (UPF0264 family) [Oharaeibacter diazotrophicus]BBE71146.1 hypothetical protein OHA_1_00716 [Pleomorphomonas sp. SM30]GLS77900.1 hypothetical protein GCM10007904_32370 [Oharaeibacter diazotrophicus]